LSKGFAIICGVIIGIACSDEAIMNPTRPLSPPPGPSFSDGFYQGSDGYYFWDGQPPPGDESPAIITRTYTEANAPKIGTDGFIYGEIGYIGDESKIDLVYSVDSLDHHYYSAAVASTGWERITGSPWFDRQEQQKGFSYSLGLHKQCNFSLEVGGTGYARKSLPFGIAINLLKMTIAIGPGATSWGEVSAPMQASSDPGYSCDNAFPASDCDNRNTPEIEYCPVPGDPANPPYPNARYTEVTNTEGDYGGYSSPGGYVGGVPHCVDWIDWFVSFDGGKTWHYDYRECTQWEME
jgi:hypothetical protein